MKICNCSCPDLASRVQTLSRCRNVASLCLFLQIFTLIFSTCFTFWYTNFMNLSTEVDWQLGVHNFTGVSGDRNFYVNSFFALFACEPLFRLDLPLTTIVKNLNSTSIFIYCLIESTSFIFLTVSFILSRPWRGCWFLLSCSS